MDRPAESVPLAKETIGGIMTEHALAPAAATAGRCTRLTLLIIASIVAVFAFAIAPSGAGAFGVSNFTYTNSSLQASGHPDVTIGFQRTGTEDEDLKDIQLDLPTGVFANPEAANPKCTTAQFNADACPANSLVGSVTSTVKAMGLLDMTIKGTVNVLVADPNQTATMGITLRPDSICILWVFCAVPQKIFLKTGVTLRSYEDSGLRSYTAGTPRSAVIGIPLIFVTPTITGDITVNSMSLTFQSRSGPWTTKRVCGGLFNLFCSDVPVPPSGPYFFRQAGSCTPISANAKLVSYQGAEATASSSYTPTGCNLVNWNPQIEFSPSNTTGNVGSPITFKLKIPEADQAIQDALPKIVDSDMPAGSGLNLTALTGVTGCSEAELKQEACPSSSIIGTAYAFSKYMPAATNPNTNPGLVGNVYAMGVGNQIPIAVAVVGPGHTVVIFRGTMGTRGDANAGTGRVYATFDRIPQLPFREFGLTITKPVYKNPGCGTATTTANITAFNGTTATNGNGTVATRSSAYTVSPCDVIPHTNLIAAPSGTTTDNTPTFTFDSSVSTAVFQCRMDGAGDFVPCSSPYTAQPLADGPHYIEIKAINGTSEEPTPLRYDFTVSTIGISVVPHITVSDTQAAGHPDISASFDVSGGQPKQIALRMPSGFSASLAAVPQCSLADANNNTCPADSKVGTATATVERYFNGSNGTEAASADIYLTVGPTGDDAAGLTGVAHFSFGDVKVQGGAYLVNNGTNQYLTLRDVPRESGTTQFNVTNLTTSFSGANGFLTNATNCTTAKSWKSSGTDWAGNQVAVFDVPYQATGCSTLPFAPTIEQILTDPTAGAMTGVNATVTIPAGNSAVRALRVNEPPSIGPNFPSFGQMADQCPSSAAPLPTSVFDPTLCPPQSYVGTMTIDTPLLPYELTGDVYLINKSPLPWMGVVFEEPGISVHLTGVTATPQVDPSCDPATDPWGFCQTQISILFNNVPDVPMSKISMALDGPARTGVGGASLPGQVLRVASPGDSTCVGSSPARATFVPFSGTPPLTIDQPITITGC